MKDEKLIELKQVGHDQELDKIVESEFKIVGEEDFDKEETLFDRHPTKYYEFADKDGGY